MHWLIDKKLSQCAKQFWNWFSFFLVFLKSSLWRDLFYAFTLEVICQDIPVFTKGKGRAWGWNDKATHRKARPEAISSIIEKFEMAEKNYIYIHLEIFVLPSEMENILPFKPRKPRNKCCRKVSKRQDFLRMYLERAFFPISSFVIIEKITSFC